MTNGVVMLSFDCKGYTKGCVDDENTASICWGPYVLAAVSEDKDYIIIPKTDISLLQHKGNMEFELGDISFKPLNTISSEHYHLYVKIK